MNIFGDLDFKEVGQLIQTAVQIEPGADFPSNAGGSDIKQGRITFFNNRVWIAIELVTGGSPETTNVTWIPLTAEINAFEHIQSASSTSWVISHNLKSNDPIVIIYDDTDNMIIPDEIVPTDEDTVTVTLNTTNTGKAIILVGKKGNGVDRSEQQFAYEHIQGTVSTTWVVSHALGYYPEVRVFVDNGGNDEEILPATVVHDSVMQVTITFSVAESGRARFV